MASEEVLAVSIRRHVINGDRPFSAVLDGIYQGIGRPDIAGLFRELSAAASYEEFSSLVGEAQGSAGLMQFLELDLDAALSIDPQGRPGRLVRLIAGNPVTMGEMTRHVPDAGSYAPVTILVEETPEGGTRVAYDTVASALDPEHLDGEVLTLLRRATGAAAPITGAGHPNT
jgi:uncharacterized protein (DUF302 family)